MLECSGPVLLKKYLKDIKILDLNDCVEHADDWGQWKTDNFIQKPNNIPLKYFDDKIAKKSFYKDKAKELKEDQITPLIYIFLLMLGFLAISLFIWMSHLTKLYLRLAA